MHEEYILGLKKALEIVEDTARFGIEKTVTGIKAEIKKVENDKQVPKQSV